MPIAIIPKISSRFLGWTLITLHSFSNTALWLIVAATNKRSMESATKCNAAKAVLRSPVMKEPSVFVNEIVSKRAEK